MLRRLHPGITPVGPSALRPVSDDKILDCELMG